MAITPSKMNKHLRAVMIAPITSRGSEGYPTRINITVGDVREWMDGWIVLDQIRTIYKARFCERVGILITEDILSVKSTIKEILID